eukprot:3856511-Amphidinium_carterae.1
MDTIVFLDLGNWYLMIWNITCRGWEGASLVRGKWAGHKWSAQRLHPLCFIVSDVDSELVSTLCCRHMNACIILELTDDDATTSIPHTTTSDCSQQLSRPFLLFCSTEEPIIT